MRLVYLYSCTKLLLRLEYSYSCTKLLLRLVYLYSCTKLLLTNESLFYASIVDSTPPSLPPHLLLCISHFSSNGSSYSWWPEEDDFRVERWRETWIFTSGNRSGNVCSLVFSRLIPLSSDGTERKGWVGMSWVKKKNKKKLKKTKKMNLKII